MPTTRLLAAFVVSIVVPWRSVRAEQFRWWSVRARFAEMAQIAPEPVELPHDIYTG